MGRTYTRGGIRRNIMIKLEINELKETINNNEILKKYNDNFKNSIKGPFASSYPW